MLLSVAGIPSESSIIIYVEPFRLWDWLCSFPLIWIGLHVIRYLLTLRMVRVQRGTASSIIQVGGQTISRLSNVHASSGLPHCVFTNMIQHFLNVLSTPWNQSSADEIQERLKFRSSAHAKKSPIFDSSNKNLIPDYHVPHEWPAVQ